MVNNRPTVYNTASVYNENGGGGGDLPEGLIALNAVLPSSTNYSLKSFTPFGNSGLEYTYNCFFPNVVTNTNGNYAILNMLRAASTNRTGVRLLGHGGGSNNLHFNINNGTDTDLVTMHPMAAGEYEIIIKNNNCYLKSPLYPDGANFNINKSNVTDIDNLYIGGASAGDFAQTAIKEIKAVLNGVTLFDFVGVKRIYDGKISLFDKVSNFFDNSHNYTEYTP